MTATTKEKLARAEFWSMEAMNAYGPGDERHKILAQAHDLIKRASAKQEDEDWQHVMKAIQQ